MKSKKIHVAFLMGGLSSERSFNNQEMLATMRLIKKNIMQVKSLLIRTFIIKFLLLNLTFVSMHYTVHLMKMELFSL